MRLLHFICLLSGLLVLSACAPWRALLIFENRSECGGPIAIRLTNERTGEVIRERVADGQQLEIELRPDDWYSYIVDFTAAGRRPDGFRCVALKEGRLRIPQGSVPLRIPLESQLQVPTPSPAAP
ncbi:MAG: hypothetical protein SNJ58_07615 [Aggregatilineales bacterium]